MSDFLKTVEKSKDILIVSHQKPDGDAIGSSYALYYALKQLGKQVLVWQKDDFPENLTFLKEDFFVQGSLPFTPDTLILLDCADRGRAGINPDEFPEAVLINIDHHHTNIGYGDLALVESGASSTSEVLYYLLQDHVKMNGEIATGLYVGIATDTNRFYYDSTGTKTLRAVENLMKHINLFYVNTKLYGSKSYNTLKLQAYSINHLQFLHNGSVAYLEISKEVQEELQSTDTEDIVELLRDIEGVKLSVLLYEHQGKLKASLRSKVDEIDVSVIALELGGGGHKKASGITFPNVDFAHWRNLLLQRISELPW